MAKGLDWDAAAKRDYIRDHGSIPYWVGLPKPKSLESRPEQTKVGKALAKKARSRASGVVAEFAKLSPESKLASADQYRERIRRLCADERRSVPPSKKRYVAAITSAERDLIGQIKGHVKRAKAGPKAPATAPRHATPATLGIPLDQKPQTAKQSSKPSVARQTKKKSAKKPAAPTVPKARKRPSMFSGLSPITVESQIVEGRLVVTWEADARVDRWMLTLLRRRNSGVQAVERVAVPAATTSATLAAKMSDGPYSLRLFGIGSDGPLTRGALDGIGSRPKALKPHRTASTPKSATKHAGTRKSSPKKAAAKKGPGKKRTNAAGIRNAMRNSAPSGRPHRARFWRGR